MKYTKEEVIEMLKEVRTNWCFDPEISITEAIEKVIEENELR